MFRNILLSYLPDDRYSEMSPIKFHLKLLSPKSFYGINLKYGIDNRRLVQTDTNFSFFDDYNIAFDSLNDENFYYSYKNFSILNTYDNVNIYTICSAVSIAFLRVYKDYNIQKYIKPILFWLNYLLAMFFLRMKSYPYTTDKENFLFMKELLEKLILHLEITKAPKEKVQEAEKNVKEMMKILNSNIDFLLFIYNLSKKLYSFFWEKTFTDILLYEYIFSANLLDFPSESEIKKLLKENAKKIYLKRETFYIDVDMITLIWFWVWELAHISYLIDENNKLFVFPYFINSLSFIDKINFSLKDPLDIVENILDFKLWGEKFINELRNFNSENIDINIDPSIWFEKIQEMMSKEMMESVKKVSYINENFLDFYIYLISRKLNGVEDTYQFEFLYNTHFVWKFSIKKDLNIIYKWLDLKYFTNSYFYKFKKTIKEHIDIYDFTKRVLPSMVYATLNKKIFSDFQRKTHKEYILDNKYFDIIKKYFSKNIRKLLKQDVRKNYIKKYFSWSDFEPTKQQILNFRENIYYPDFIVFYEVLNFVGKKVPESSLQILARLKESIFWYLIFRHINWYSKKIEEYYSYGIWIHSPIALNLESIYNNFYENYKEFLDYFADIKQNIRYVKVVLSTMEKYNKAKEFFVYDNLKAMTYYNKRIFKI